MTPDLGPPKRPRWPPCRSQVPPSPAHRSADSRVLPGLGAGARGRGWLRAQTGLVGAAEGCLHQALQALLGAPHCPHYLPQRISLRTALRERQHGLIGHLEGGDVLPTQPVGEQRHAGQQHQPRHPITFRGTWAAQNLEMQTHYRTGG